MCCRSRRSTSATTQEQRYVTWTPLHYVESRADEQTLYAAWATHHLAMVDGATQDPAEAGRPRQL